MTLTETAPADAAEEAPGPSTNDPALVTHPLIEDELLVEEISIDGMCGVY
jgi:mycofactocin precursor